MTALVEARAVSKHYGKLRAVDDVSFNIEPGRIVGLIGPNGAGKTTLLKAVLGLTGFDGQLSVCGHDPRKDRRTLMHDVSYVADESPRRNPEAARRESNAAAPTHR
ncbi:MAG: ATP-binding cassette domain-containing protein, partial [Pseudomonadota bacterium]